jgi:hypothetical protein
LKFQELQTHRAPFVANVTRPSGQQSRRGKIISIYDEQGRRLTNLLVGSGPKDGLQGFTSATVSVRFGTVINIYNEKGRRLSAVSAGR